MVLEAVASEHAEQAQAAVMGVLANLRLRAGQRFIVSDRRIWRDGKGVGNAATIDAPSNAVAQMTMIAQQFMLERLTDSTADGLPLNNELVALLWEGELRRLGGSRESVDKAWQEWHQIKLSRCPVWEAFLGCVDARNSIVHGLGRLTNRQVRRQPAVAAGLQLAGISLSGDRLVVTIESAEQCAAVMSYAILWLDLEALSEPT